MRRDSLIAMLGDFIGLHNSPAYKPPRLSPSDCQSTPQQQKKKRAASMYCGSGDLPTTDADAYRKSKSSTSRRQSEPAIKHSPRHHKSRKTSTTSQRSSITVSSNPASESSDSSVSHHKARRGSETLLGSIALFSKPLVVINGRM
uniref:Uncharacterized protein n=1 Tax=Plectus sambesii TaxID=2011161 RepID=A0A914US10_9BILA